MTSKLRFLGDGMAGVYVHPYFSQHSSPLSALLEPWKPAGAPRDDAFEPSLDHSSGMTIGATTYDQILTTRHLMLTILTKERSISLPITREQCILVAAAAEYLVREQDGIDDQRPIVGYEDDLKVINHVLEELEMFSYFILPP